MWPPKLLFQLTRAHKSFHSCPLRKAKGLRLHAIPTWREPHYLHSIHPRREQPKHRASLIMPEPAGLPQGSDYRPVVLGVHRRPDEERSSVIVREHISSKQLGRPVEVSLPAHFT